MRESDPSSEMPAAIAGGRTLAWLGGCLLVGLLLQTILARVDRGRVTQLETFSETSAVGDRVYYPLPVPLPNPPAMVARVGGRELVPVSYEKFQYRDATMRASARDSATKLTIYKSREPLPDAGDDEWFFVKTAANEYLKLRAQTAAK